MNEAEALALVTYISSAYPSVPLSPETTAVYVEQLVELPFEVVRAAAVRHIQSCKWFPTIAELRLYAGAEWEPPTATEAWIEVTESLRAGRGFGRIESDPIVRRAAEAVWGDAYDAPIDPDHRRFFLRVFDDLRERAILDRRLGLADGSGAERSALGPGGEEGEARRPSPSPARAENLRRIAVNVGAAWWLLEESQLRDRLGTHLERLVPEALEEERQAALEAGVRAWGERRAEHEGAVR